MSKQKYTSDLNPKLFCAVKEGKNTCKICYEICYFSTKYPTCNILHVNKQDFPTLQLLRCGHGMCINCYIKYTPDPSLFKCPFCRNRGRIAPSGTHYPPLYMTEFVYSNTYKQFLHEFVDNLDLLQFSGDPFVKLSRQIMNEHLVARKEAILRKAIVQHAAEKNITKIQKDLSRKRAICPQCFKNTFTSEKQLAIHMHAKHKDYI